jgi:hypothetical protein
LVKLNLKTISNTILFEKINQLPGQLKIEVLDFVEFLELKNFSESIKDQTEIKKSLVFDFVKLK